MHKIINGLNHLQLCLIYMSGKSGLTDSLACRKSSTFLASPLSPSEGPYAQGTLAPGLCVCGRGGGGRECVCMCVHACVRVNT